MSARRVEIGRPTPPSARRWDNTPPLSVREELPEEMPPTLPVTAERENTENETPRSSESPTGAFLKPFGGLLGNVGRAFPFSHGIGFDEILILGLILLLAREEESSDLVLWLALLLFCG